MSAPLMTSNLRAGLLLLVFLALAGVLVGRAFWLQVMQHGFYVAEAQGRHLRTQPIMAHRGDLLDRNGEPLAISTPIQTLVGVPGKMLEDTAGLERLAGLLGKDAQSFAAQVRHKAGQGRQFMYIRRHLAPDVADKALALQVAGVSARREFRRYYPSGRSAAHVVGFTDLDDRGQEGLEMTYDQWLRGQPGKRQVVRDLRGRVIADEGVLKPGAPGRDLRLSIDRQLQYLVDKALVAAVSEQQAESASAVVMQVHTGEVLAMSNVPSYNPNDRADRSNGRQRNRAITDVFEPGSTMKPFTVAAALESGRVGLTDTFDTSPGYYNIGKYEISDQRDNGALDLAGIVRQSSNVGISKVAALLEPEQMWSVFDRFGFGHAPGSGFPGEVAGYFNHPSLWHRVEQASVSFGYGLSVSALQLTRAYAALANHGVLPPVSFVLPEAGTDEAAEPGVQIIDPAIDHSLQGMLENVVLEGTGHRAAVPGYRVAGKTGTSRRSQSGGYAEDRYVSVFAGFAPVSQPEIAVVVVIHDPSAGDYFGSLVAAPVFSDIMGHALRLMGVQPDDPAALAVADRGTRS